MRPFSTKKILDAENVLGSTQITESGTKTVNGPKMALTVLISASFLVNFVALNAPGLRNHFLIFVHSLKKKRPFRKAFSFTNRVGNRPFRLRTWGTGDPLERQIFPTFELLGTLYLK